MVKVLRWMNQRLTESLLGESQNRPSQCVRVYEEDSANVFKRPGKRYFKALARYDTIRAVITQSYN